MPFPSRRLACFAALAYGCSLVTGCASPGVPKAPSLLLPAAPKNLTADRIGSAVSLRFTVPQRTTDDLPVRTASLGLKICRELPPGPCAPLPQIPNTVSTRNSQGGPNTLTLTDQLPAELSSGAPRVMAYRIQFENARGHAGPLSEAAYAAAGAAPANVSGFTAAGTRLGVLLSWGAVAPDGSEVILHRDTASSSTRNVPLLLRASENGAASTQSRSLDTGAEDGVTYRYTAERQRKVVLGGRTLLLSSEPTPPVVFTLHDTFPPPVPTDLTVAAFTTDDKFSIDLIWQPVEDPGLAGYNVYREPLDSSTPRVRLNPAPLPTPAFHDTTAKAAASYRYSVTAIDRKGNESAAVTATSSAQ